MIWKALRELFFPEKESEKRGRKGLSRKQNFTPAHDVMPLQEELDSTGEEVHNIFMPGVPGIDLTAMVVTKWYVNPGFMIRKGQVICRLENADVSIEFESAVEGRVLYIHPLRERIPVGAPVCRIVRT